MDAAPSSGRTRTRQAQVPIILGTSDRKLKMAPGRCFQRVRRIKRPDPKLFYCSVYARVTCSACNPLGPRFTMKDTRAPSSSVRYPLASIAEKCTNTSSPLSRWINPKPFPALNHFTVPVSFTFSPCCYFVIGIRTRIALKWTVTRRSPLIATPPPLTIVARLRCPLHYRETLLVAACAQGAGLAFPYASQHGRLPFDVF